MHDFKQSFIDICHDINRDGIDELLDYLEKGGFFYAPASTTYHGAYEGGLCKHSMDVLDAMMRISITYLPDAGYLIKEYSIETIAIVALFHDVCKIDSYKAVVANDDIHRKYIWNPESIPLGHGEKSVMILQDFIKLTDEEKLAIRWHMGPFDKAFMGGEKALNSAFQRSDLSVMLHLADMMATYFYK